jgi:LD-carboxypeptidase N-terminal domain
MGVAALLSAPAFATQSATPVGKASRKPPRLRVGDTVGLIEPATASDEPFQIQLVEEAIVAMGLKPKRAPHILDRYGYLAGRDKDRAADVNAMFADKDVKAIFAVRGGWGSARLLPYLDWDIIRANPKLLTGFSDITALHMAIAAKGGFVTLHGPNAGRIPPHRFRRRDAVAGQSRRRRGSAGTAPLADADHYAGQGTRAVAWREPDRPDRARWDAVSAEFRWRDPVSGRRGRGRISHRPDADTAWARRNPQKSSGRRVRTMHHLHRQQQRRLWRLHRE